MAQFLFIFLKKIVFSHSWEHIIYKHLLFPTINNTKFKQQQQQQQQQNNYPQILGLKGVDETY